MHQRASLLVKSGPHRRVSRYRCILRNGSDITDPTRPPGSARSKPDAQVRPPDARCGVTNDVSASREHNLIYCLVSVRIPSPTIKAQTGASTLDDGFSGCYLSPAGLTTQRVNRRQGLIQISGQCGSEDRQFLLL